MGCPPEGCVKARPPPPLEAAAGCPLVTPGHYAVTAATAGALRPGTGQGCGPKPVPGIPAVVARGTTAPYHYLIYHVYMVATVNRVGDSPRVAREGEMT